MPKATILYIHPFAEELNRTRRMAALHCHALAAVGFEVLQIDMTGCGDSAGQFEDATWEAWVQDVTAARDWLTARNQRNPLRPKNFLSAQNTLADTGRLIPDTWMWGVRAGCLIAAEVARRDAHLPARLLFWQPVMSGALHLNQFLRLRVATDLVRGDKGAGADNLRQHLAHGLHVEIGGYTLSPALAAGLEGGHLDGLPQNSRILGVEISGLAEATLSPSITIQIQRWRAQNCQVDFQPLQAPQFWQMQEIGVSQRLIDHTVKALQSTLTEQPVAAALASVVDLQ